MRKPLCAYVYSSNLNHLGNHPFDNPYVKEIDIIYYSFVHVEPDATLSFASGFKTYLLELKSSHPRIVASINGAKNLSNICIDPSLRKQLVCNLIQFLKENKLSGIDIDWEVPGSNKYNVETDKTSLNAFAKELKEQMDEGMLLTMAVHGTPLGDNKYDYVYLNSYIDYYNVMSYDAHIDDMSSHVCPLYPVQGLSRNYSIDEAYYKLIKNGMDKEKMIISASFYGKVYQLDEEPIDGIIIGKKAHFIDSEYKSGTAHFHYIKKFYNEKSGFALFFDARTCATYAYHPKTRVFVTYDDERSVKKKANYAKEKNIGMMFWDYGGDLDCSLLKTIIQNFK